MPLTPLQASDFAALMAPLGPWDARRHVAVAVSGGADSMALCLLAAGWGEVLALIVDHGLRPESASEARVTATRLAARGIRAEVLTLAVQRGPRLAERARAARYAALGRACTAAGLADLLLGHHAGDQAETALLRARHGSGAAGLAGMAAVRATAQMRLLRPLLTVPPGRLRAALRACGMGWVEDPSNADPRAERARLRALLAWADGQEAASAGLLASAAFWSARRADVERGVAAALAAGATLRPEGFAVLSGPVSEAALSSLVRMIGGRRYPPAPAAVARLAEAVRAGRAATLAGVRLMTAGRLGAGHLLVREAAACAPPSNGAAWDGRFRLPNGVAPPAGSSIGALGDSARLMRGYSALPAAVLRGLPAWWRGNKLLAVPHLGYPNVSLCREMALVFDPAAET